MGKFLKSFVPPTCASCNKSGEKFCRACQQKLLWIKNPICTQCGSTVKSGQQICWDCQRRPPLLKQTRAAVVFATTIRPAIYALKYRKQFGMAQSLAHIMADGWKQWQTQADLMIPVPLHAERQNARTFNQSEKLAHHFAPLVGLPMTTDALFRIRNTPRQVTLRQQQRKLNVIGAFVANSDVVSGKRILLIDDVCTTGSTLTASAETLLEAGATSVSAYCVARAMRVEDHTFDDFEED